MQRNHELRIKVNLDELRRAKEIAKLEGSNVSEVMRRRLLSESKPEILHLLQEIHKKLLKNSNNKMEAISL